MGWIEEIYKVGGFLVDFKTRLKPGATAPIDGYFQPDQLSYTDNTTGTYGNDWMNDIPDGTLFQNMYIPGKRKHIFLGQNSHLFLLKALTTAALDIKSLL